MCIALAVGLWGLWITAIAASLYLSLYAVSLAGLGLAAAALVVAAGALARVVAVVLYTRRRAFHLLIHVRELGPIGRCGLDSSLSARLGVEVYKCYWDWPGEAIEFPKPRVVVNHIGLSEDEVEAVAYHELSHLRRHDAVVRGVTVGAAKASAVAAVFQLASAAGAGNLAYVVAAAFASYVMAQEIDVYLGGEGDDDTVGKLSALILSLGAALTALQSLVTSTPLGPAPQLSPLDAVASALAALAAYLASRFAVFASELLSDVDSSLATGPVRLKLLVRKEREEREALERLKAWLKERGLRYPTLRDIIDEFLEMYPPISIRKRVARLCARGYV